MEKGSIHLFLGPMFSGKTKAAMNYLQENNYSLSEIGLFQSSWNKRDGNLWKSRGLDYTIPAKIIDLRDENFMNDLEYSIKDKKVIGIDEPFSFDLILRNRGDNLARYILNWKEKGKKIIIPSIHTYFNRQGVEVIGDLWKHADSIVFCTESRCTGDNGNCKNVGTMTQRFRYGIPSNFNESKLINEGEEGYSYCPRCLEHHIVPGLP